MSRKRLRPEQIIMALHQSEAAPAGAESLEELWITALYANLRKAEGHFVINSLSLRILFPPRAFNSSLLTVLYRLNTLIVLCPLAAMIRK